MTGNARQVSGDQMTRQDLFIPGFGKTRRKNFTVLKVSGRLLRINS
jgi:hypothetical protein